jgi:hypothetical protein
MKYGRPQEVQMLLKSAIYLFLLFGLHPCSFAQNNLRKISVFVAQTESDSISINFQTKGGKKYAQKFEIFFYKINANLRQPITDSIRHLDNWDKLIMYVPQEKEVFLTHIFEFKKVPTSFGEYWSGKISSKLLVDYVCKNGIPDNCTQISKTGFQVFVKQTFKKKNTVRESNVFRIDNGR